MNEQEQRIAIAATCPSLFRVAKESGDIIWMRDGHEEDCDPLNDLNAMHEAEKTLNGNEVGPYVDLLIAGRKATEHLAVFATAAQRAEAFLKTKGLL